MGFFCTLHPNLALKKTYFFLKQSQPSRRTILRNEKNKMGICSFTDLNNELKLPLAHACPLSTDLLKAQLVQIRFSSVQLFRSNQLS